MRIAIVGSGGLGGYFGGRLAAAGADVSFLARGAHLEALQSRGLRIESPNGNLHLPRVTATDDASKVGPVDVTFFAVKLYDTESALPLLPPLVGPDSVVIPFQNGVESVDMLSRAVDRRHLAGGTSYIQAALEQPGVIRHIALDRIIFGELDGTRTPRLERLSRGMPRGRRQPGAQRAYRRRDLVQVRAPDRAQRDDSRDAVAGRAAA